jgi:AAA domain (dynein-related subfamily)
MYGYPVVLLPDMQPSTTLGATVHAGSVVRLLRHATQQAFRTGTVERPTPVCIWGAHGIGKTEVVRGLAKELGCPLVYIAPAQFEEMGDLIGMPKIGPDGTTVLAPPAWVPKENGPGILLLDDINRADDRILRGLMQLIQYYELVSWRLPERWLIVLTANPDDGNYSVTPLDQAMLNRMLHVTLAFDVHEWAQWAQRAGIDSRGINFVLAYPELINGRATTPRSLVQFFSIIEGFDDLQAELPLIKMLGEACLEPETITAFVNFVHLRLDQLPTPEQILDPTVDFEALMERLTRLTTDQGTKRLDILSIIVRRLTHYLLAQPELVENAAILQRLSRFLLHELLPNDLRLSMAQELTGKTEPQYKSLSKLYAVPELGALLLRKM